MKGRSGILCAGNWVVDRVKTIDAWPDEETLVNILSESRQNGGAPFNVLIDLARLGAKFPLEGLGLIGEDADGDFILDMCQSHGIDASRLIRVPESTSYTDVMAVAGSDRRTFFHHRGANAKLGPEHFDFSKTRARHLHLGYLTLLDGLDKPDAEFGTHAARVLNAALDHGMTTSIDLVSSTSGNFADVVAPALCRVDICFMNERELAQLTGIAIPEDEPVGAMREATRRLCGMFMLGTAAIHSAGYAYVRNPVDIEFFRPSVALRPDQIKGSVGAGDAFAAGYLFAFLEGNHPITCLQWGVAAGASCLLGEGASNGVLPIGEALKMVGAP